MTVARIAVLALLLGGCLFSEQSGPPAERLDLHAGPGADSLGDVSFHFRGTMNYIMLAGRLALAGFLVWFAVRVIKARKQAVWVRAVLGLIACGALWLAGTGLVKVVGYHIEVTQKRLSISIPFDADLDVPWSLVSSVTIEGTAEYRSGNLRSDTAYKKWDTLRVTAKGKKHVIDLDDLTFIQRTNLFNAIAKRSGLQEWEIPGPRL